MSENVTLTRNQKRALAALLASKTIAEAAAACGLTEKTLYRYMDRVEFIQALTLAERETIDTATRRLLSGQVKALDVLEAVMKTSNYTDQRQAAATWLSYTLKYKNLDIEARVIALEKAVLSGNK